jgi:transcriptional regulator with XRE-family HTH domain
VPSELDAARSAFGSRLRKLRLGVGLTQEEVSRRADISRAMYAKAENGKVNLGIDVIFRLASALVVEVEELFRADYR